MVPQTNKKRTNQKVPVKKTVKKTVKKQPVKPIKKEKKKKIRIKYKNILFFLLIILLLVFIGIGIFKLPIKNIVIKGNTFLTDQQIIELAQIENYPSSLENPASVIKNRLEKNVYIASTKVKKQGLQKVVIEVIENRPLLYNSNIHKTVLLNKTTVEKQFNVPYLVNYVPDELYNAFIEAMGNVNSDILRRISEIQYKPNDVDTERFFLTMNDGNYVYLTIQKFDHINQYLEIVKNFNNKKGILYLDSGEYFQILEN